MQKGFIPIIFIIIVAVLGLVSIVVVKKFKDLKIPEQTVQTTESNNEISPTDSPIPTSSPKVNKIPTLTTIPTQKPSVIPTSNPSFSNNSCPYDLTGPTGAIKVDIKPQTGLVVGDQTVELQARSGCKVLDGRSTDKQTMIARAGGNGYSSQNSVTYSTVPAGPYSVRIQYKGQWTEYRNIDAVSTQSRTVEIFVEGGTPPSTPTPVPKPICSVIVMPSNTGTAPYQASVCVGNNSNPYQSVQQEFVDYNGDGNWDYQGPSYGCHSFTFQNQGSFSPKAKIVGTSGQESDVCQTSVTIN